GKDVHAQRHDERQDKPGLAAQQVAHDQEKAGQSRQKERGAKVVHGRKDGPRLWRIKAGGGIMRGMTDAKKPAAEQPNHEPTNPVPTPQPKKVEEIGGPPGPEPTRYGDWQFNGKVTDF